MRHVHGVVRAAALLAVAAAVAGCKQESHREKYVPGAAPVVLGIQTADIKSAIAARIDNGAPPTWSNKERWRRVHALYARYGNAPLWLEPDGVKARAGALLAAIKAAPDDALSTAGYPLDSIQQVVGDPSLTKNANARGLADADVLMTAAFVAYATDMLIGQVDPKSVSQAWHIPVSLTEVDSALVDALQQPAMDTALMSMAPQDSDYAVLKEAYAHYRQLASAGPWPTVSTGAAGVSDLRVRLAAEGYLAEATPIVPVSNPTGKSAGRLAGPVSLALKVYQNRHGLDANGALNAATVSELNVPVAERTRQIALNLERHRWLPRNLGSRYVYVNVPSFRLDAYDSGHKVLSMKVVVGAEYEGKVTPVFSDSMETVVFRPYWNITPDIQKGEIGPKVEADPGYLERSDMEYYKDGGTTRIRQRPGDKNSLGLVKFLFPNSFNIYLHDTPAKALFEQTNRAASHGCIRLSRPDLMAQYALGWTPERVAEAMHSGTNNNAVNVPKKIPVYIVYFTSYVRDGLLYFGDDLYKRDAALEQQMAASGPDSASPDSAR